MASQLSSGDLLADRRYRYAEACLAEGDHAGVEEEHAWEVRLVKQEPEAEVE